MTHSLHRTGYIEGLEEDFPMLTHVARGYNDIGAGERLKEMAKIARKYTDLNFGDCKVANKFMVPPEEIMEKHTVGWQVVFKDKENLIACMEELKEKNIGISVIVSGLFDEVFDCCQKTGITPPLIEFALGIHGNKEKIWPPEILDFVTMCGHGLVSSNLVKKMLDEVKKNKITIEEAAIELAKPCLCGIFNPHRAARLLRKLTQ